VAQGKDPEFKYYYHKKKFSRLSQGLILHPFNLFPPSLHLRPHLGSNELFLERGLFTPFAFNSSPSPCSFQPVWNWGKGGWKD
jgi:hypothetical protein